MTEPRNWDKEMADIDKLLAQPAPPAGSAPARRDGAAPVAARPPVAGTVQTRGLHVAGVWGQALLGAATAAALPFWPYLKSCGTMLYLYVAVTALVSMFGLWTMRTAWTHRRGVAHIVGLLVFLTGLGFAAFEVLQRSSLVAVRLPWICP